ncbi:hypothetical protein BDW02DRAFT_595292 [Decorospora gaudefroyi]|uniref:Apple domain-containing protein n=1 Tax=Decorospora gaudefroyi TaxID=184978 RepID=A0A6A5KNT8_9PLEO|nr:hypothetical protein BDW02DRAFT_595292 [Decorospora gaudefroyi]
MLSRYVRPISLLVALTSFVSFVSGAQVCGLIGLHNETTLSFYMGNFFFKGPTTFALCASYCKKDAPRCKSFRYSYWGDANAQYCEFFDSALGGNVTADSTQPYWYYDIGYPNYNLDVHPATDSNPYEYHDNYTDIKRANNNNNHLDADTNPIPNHYLSPNNNADAIPTRNRTRSYHRHKSIHQHAPPNDNSHRDAHCSGGERNENTHFDADFDCGRGRYCDSHEYALNLRD